ncbi:DUF4386 domain-containing protein [Actinomadura rudentiformis]|uniref:DUF4386 domain-containing protein n=1 Tax=Actinomadura rudentiformis TaxID=359158 RepID=A0A6H9YIT5_9ACTN|nr:DUF4386 domain-containing protein [Actinomadura rudentiformis]KAB2339662.1 DUF4386 domain-containing protein [Actinomadura rudentiformis]
MGIATLDESQRKAARVVGFTFLLLMAAGFFSQIYIPSRVIVDGSAAETASAILANERLFRIGIAFDILIFAGDMVLAVALYVLLRPISQGLATLGAFLRLAQATMMGFNALNFLTALMILEGPGELRALSTEQSQALASAYNGTHTAGFNLGLIYIGLGSAVFSYLLLKSNYVPRALAVLGVFANVVLTTFTLALIVFPGAEDAAVVAIGRFVPVFFFEVGLGFWLLLKGARVSTAIEPARA